MLAIFETGSYAKGEDVVLQFQRRQYIERDCERKECWLGTGIRHEMMIKTFERRRLSLCIEECALTYSG